MTYFQIAGAAIGPGERRQVNVGIARLYDFTDMGIPVEVVRGKQDGPVLFVCGALHGDEILGTEIIRRLLRHPGLKRIRGILLAVPIVNVFGFNTKSRYLPDRRDLNRSFPGSEEGSLAARLAHAFMSEIVSKSTHGIDLHTAAIHRNNLPQVRACIDDDPETLRLAQAFHAPVILNAALREGSIREAARQYRIPMLVYEGGEALRLDENAVSFGVRGVLSVMRAIGMLPESTSVKKQTISRIAQASYWVRAPQSGMLTPRYKLGSLVEEGSVLGVISDPFGNHQLKLEATRPGVIIGETSLPLLNEGDAAFHIATFDKPDDGAVITEFRSERFEEKTHSEVL